MARAKRAPKEPKVTLPRVVQFRLSEADYAKLKRDAQAAGIAPNECARLKTTGGVVTVRQSYELPFAVTYELGRIGVNMNQIARQLNMTGEHEPAELAEACERMDEMLRVILAAVSD